MLKKLKHAIEVNSINDYFFPKGVVDISALKFKEVKQICKRFIEYESNAEEVKQICKRLIEYESNVEEEEKEHIDVSKSGRLDCLSEASMHNNYNSRSYKRNCVILQGDNTHKKKMVMNKQNMQDRGTTMHRTPIISESKYQQDAHDEEFFGENKHKMQDGGTTMHRTPIIRESTYQQDNQDAELFESNKPQMQERGTTMKRTAIIRESMYQDNQDGELSKKNKPKRRKENE